MKTRRFDYNWKPLQLNLSMSTEGSVPQKQAYDSFTGEYSPDYTLTPVVIQPEVSIIDKDGVLASGSVNAQLSSIKWYETANGTRTQIATDSSDYEITQSGSQAGRIRMKKNVQPQQPVTLSFYAEYAVARNNQVFAVQGSTLVTCASESSLVRVSIDQPSVLLYDPLHDADSLTITADIWVGGTKGSPSWDAVWSMTREDGASASLADSACFPENAGITDGGDGTLTVDMTLQGDETDLQAGAATGGKTMWNPSDTVAIVRRVPEYEYDIEGVPYDIPAGALSISPVATVRTTKGIVDSGRADRELLPVWYMATNKASGSLSYKQVAHGWNPTISTSGMSTLHGGVLGLDVIDRGGMCLWEDGTDTECVYTDDSGCALMIK